MSLVHPLWKILCSIHSCQIQYSVLRSYIRHIKQQHIAFWDTHWNISRLLKEFNVESSKEISEPLQQNLSSFVSLQKAFEKFFNQKTLNSLILNTIETLLLKEDVQRYLLTSGETKNDRLICEFKDCLTYKNNPLTTSSYKTIQIMLYCDVFVCANPLGNKVKKCKISSIYFALGNLPRKKRSM